MTETTDPGATGLWDEDLAAAAEAEAGSAAAVDASLPTGAEALEATAVQAQEKGSLFVARVDRESTAQEGQPIRLTVNTRRLHFFDPETGRGIYGRDDG